MGWEERLLVLEGRVVALEGVIGRAVDLRQVPEALPAPLDMRGTAREVLGVLVGSDGLHVSEWLARSGLAPATFHRWARRLKEAGYAERSGRHGATVWRVTAAGCEALGYNPGMLPPG